MSFNYDLLPTYRGEKHSYYSRYIVTSRLGDSLLGIQFSVSRVKSFDRAETQPADARRCNGEKLTRISRWRERERRWIISLKLFSFQKLRIISLTRESIRISPSGTLCNPRSFWKVAEYNRPRARYARIVSLVPLAFCNNTFFFARGWKGYISAIVSTFAVTAHYLVSAWSIPSTTRGIASRSDVRDK